MIRLILRSFDAVESSAGEAKLHRARESAAKYHDGRERHTALAEALLDVSHLAVLAGDDHVAVRYDIECDAETIGMQLRDRQLLAVENSSVEIQEDAPVEFEFDSQGDALFAFFAGLRVFHAVNVTHSGQVGARAESASCAFEDNHFHIIILFRFV